MVRIVLAGAAAVAMYGCGGGAGTDGSASTGATAPESGLVERVRVESALDSTLRRLHTLADSADALFRPVPLLTPAQESAFRRYGNAAQLARARALGVRPADSTALAAAVRDGRLVALERSTEHWVVRDLTHSEPLATPDALALLTLAARRFQERLRDMGAPPFRLEVTSVLRTAETQAELRRTNPNAAAGRSAHEYGTTIDVSYASYGAPARIEVDAPDGMAWLATRMEPVAAAILESVAARNSRELQAILGQVMMELQAEGAAMVTLERLQPVFHFTVARRLTTD